MRCGSVITWLFLGCGGGSDPGEPKGQGGAADTQAKDSGTPSAPGELRLRWVAEPGGVSWSDAREGLDWNLATLGALPPLDGTHLTLLTTTTDEVVFHLDMDAIGLDEDRAAPLRDAAAELQASSSTALFGGVDLGRFLMRTIHEPWRYYTITQACPTFSGWQARHRRDPAASFAVTDSLLVEGHRLIDFNDGPWAAVADIALVAQSGEGSIPDGTFETHEIEVVDVLPNGRQRFAVYSASGDLIAAAPPDTSPAGQPGKCMWCHEGALMSGQDNPQVEGHLDYTAWLERLDEMQSLMEAQRAGLTTTAGLTDSRRVHTLGERVVREFLHPTAGRIATEWGVSEAEVIALVDAQALSRETDLEYPTRGEVFSRPELDALVPALAADPDHPLAAAGVTDVRLVPVLADAREGGLDYAEPWRLDALPACD